MTSTLDSVLLVMVLLKVSVLLPLLIEAENTKKTYRYVYVFLSTRSCLENENVDKVRYGPLLKKLTYKIWVRGAFIWRRTVIPRFTWFPAECYKTNDTLMHSIVFQWKIKILVQFFKNFLRVEQSFPVKPGQHTFPSS